MNQHIEPPQEDPRIPPIAKDKLSQPAGVGVEVFTAAFKDHRHGMPLEPWNDDADSLARAKPTELIQGITNVPCAYAIRRVDDCCITERCAGLGGNLDHGRVFPSLMELRRAVRVRTKEETTMVMRPSAHILREDSDEWVAVVGRPADQSVTWQEQGISDDDLHRDAAIRRFGNHGWKHHL